MHAADGGHQFLLDFKSPRKFITHSLDDVLSNRVSDETWRGKIVLIGEGAESAHDFENTPLQVNMPGVELHATSREPITPRGGTRRQGNDFVERAGGNRVDFCVVRSRWRDRIFSSQTCSPAGGMLRVVRRRWSRSVGLRLREISGCRLCRRSAETSSRPQSSPATRVISIAKIAKR